MNGAKKFSGEHGWQKTLAFQPILKYFKPFTNDMVMMWNIVIPPPITGKCLVPKLDYFNDSEFWVKLNGGFLESERRTCTPNKITNLDITFEIKLWRFYTNNCFLLRNSLFGAAKFTKNADPHKYSDFETYGWNFFITKWWFW